MKWVVLLIYVLAIYLMNFGYILIAIKAFYKEKNIF